MAFARRSICASAASAAAAGQLQKADVCFCDSERCGSCVSLPRRTMHRRYIRMQLPQRRQRHRQLAVDISTLNRNFSVDSMTKRRDPGRAHATCTFPPHTEE